MSDAKPFSLAVVKGANRGQVLRTEKKRISVGSAKDNDFVLLDPEISSRHFLVLIDQGRWRIHTFSPEKSITVDRRWSHPQTGERGAIITAAAVEILLYPGIIEERVVQEEITKRSDETRPAQVASEEDLHLITNVGERPVDFEHGRTQENTVALDMSTMPTIHGERTPDEIRELARQRMAAAREVTRGQPEVFEAETAGLEWENGVPKLRPMAQMARKKGAWPEDVRTDPQPVVSDVPEVLAEPESQMMRMPGAARSEVSVLPDMDATVLPTPNTPQIAIEAPVSFPGRNAWGDPDPKDSSGQRTRSRSALNAWGDSSERKPRAQAVLPEKEPPRNVWGDRSSRAVEPRNGREPIFAKPAPPRDGGQIKLILSMEELYKRIDPALSLLREPDGELATSIRLLGTKLEEFMRTYGYRAYMISSPEALTGKTTTATNLALALAEDTHRRIALIEANFRYPRFTEIFGTPEDYGLIGLLEGHVQLSEAIAKVADRNLVILPAGGRHPSPAELLASPRFKALVAELANTVDIAIIDAPAVSPFADANILLPLVDAALMVVAENKTHATWIANAQKQLGEARILGAVYNQIPRAKLKELSAELKDRRRQVARP